MSSNSVCNHTRDKQIGLPLRGRLILLITRLIIEQLILHSVLLPLLTVNAPYTAIRLLTPLAILYLHCLHNLQYNSITFDFYQSEISTSTRKVVLSALRRRKVFLPCRFHNSSYPLLPPRGQSKQSLPHKRWIRRPGSSDHIIRSTQSLQRYRTQPLVLTKRKPAQLHSGTSGEGIFDFRFNEQ